MELQRPAREPSFDDGISSPAKKIAKLFATIGIAWTSMAIAMVADVQFRYIGHLVPVATNAPHADVAIILGASINPNGTPSDALRDRLLVGQSLYERKIVKKILISGDDGKFHADEIKTMREFLLMRGVTSTDLLEDGQGYRTYESCKRAAETFHITNAIVVTQRFHLGRALYLCTRMGIDTVGVPADLTTYRSIIFFTLRDLAASVEAWIDVNVFPPRSPV